MVTSRIALLLSLLALPAAAAEVVPAAAFSVAVGETLLIRSTSTVDGVEIGDEWIGDAEVDADKKVVDFLATAPGRTQIVLRSNGREVRYEVEVVEADEAAQVVPITEADLDP